MKDNTRKRLSELILEELAEKIISNENLKRKLEPFTDLPVEKVAEAIIKQFEYLLSSDLRDLIIYLIEQEVKADQAATAVYPLPAAENPPAVEAETGPPVKKTVAEEEGKTGHVMEKFGIKEQFELAPMDFTLLPDDWLYLYGFNYAPDSSGKGMPGKKMLMKGVDGENEIFLLDYGDVRLYMNKLSRQDYMQDKGGKLSIISGKVVNYKLEHEKILNILRGDEGIVGLPFWSIVKGRDQIIKQIEDRYVEILKSLIDVHDAIDWDVEVFTYDQHIIELPAIVSVQKSRVNERETSQTKRGKDIKLLERLMMREKNIAQEIHSQLLLNSSKAKIDYIIRLDNAFMDDWKPILSSRYTVGKEKRKNFCQTIRSLQNEYEEFRLMIKVTNPNTRFTF